MQFLRKFNYKIMLITEKIMGIYNLNSLVDRTKNNAYEN